MATSVPMVEGTGARLLAAPLGSALEVRRLAAELPAARGRRRFRAARVREGSISREAPTAAKAVVGAPVFLGPGSSAEADDDPLRPGDDGGNSWRDGIPDAAIRWGTGVPVMTGARQTGDREFSVGPALAVPALAAILVVPLFSDASRGTRPLFLAGLSPKRGPSSPARVGEGPPCGKGEQKTG
jgi:hypothetical protein